MPLKIAAFPIGHARLQNAGKAVGRRGTMAVSGSTVIRDAQPGADHDAIVQLMTDYMSWGPAGLTARARPKARPDRRATNLCGGLHLPEGRAQAGMLDQSGLQRNTNQAYREIQPKTVLSDLSGWCPGATGTPAAQCGW
jgi:hypothetical protein